MSIAIGEPAPSFELPDTEGRSWSADGAGAPATVIVFTCNHCPYALAWHERIADVARDYAGSGVRMLAINSNDADRYPRDSLEAMRARVRSEDWPMPYLHDAEQTVGACLRREDHARRVHPRRAGPPALPRRPGWRLRRSGLSGRSGCARHSTRCWPERTSASRRRNRSAARSSGSREAPPVLSQRSGHASVVGLQREPRCRPVQQPAGHVVGVEPRPAEGLGGHRRAAAAAAVEDHRPVAIDRLG